MLKELIVFSGEANIPLAEGICNYLKIEPGKVILKRFVDGELFVQFQENIRGRDVFIIQSLVAPVNDHLMQLLLMLDAARRASAGRITAVIPYYGYGRQDRKSAPRVPISARVVADLLEVMCPNRLLCMDLHADQVQGFFRIPADHLYAAPVFVDYLKGKTLCNPVVVSPDSGGVERARFLARQMQAGLAIIDKRRVKANEAEAMHVIGDVSGKDCILYDDMIDTGGTIVQAAEALKKNGANQILACASHAVLSNDAPERLHNSCFDKILFSNTIALPASKEREKIQILTVAPIFGEAILRIHNEESVSSLFL